MSTNRKPPQDDGANVNAAPPSPNDAEIAAKKKLMDMLGLSVPVASKPLLSIPPQAAAPIISSSETSAGPVSVESQVNKAILEATMAHHRGPDKDDNILVSRTLLTTHLNVLAMASEALAEAMKREHVLERANQELVARSDDLEAMLARSNSENRRAEENAKFADSQCGTMLAENKALNEKLNELTAKFDRADHNFRLLTSVYEHGLRAIAEENRLLSDRNEFLENALATKEPTYYDDPWVCFMDALSRSM